MRVNAPVKLQWTREDDFAHDFFRPGGFHMVKGAIGKDGKIAAWQNHHITYSHDGKIPVMAGEMASNFFPVGLVPNVRFSRSLIAPFLTPTGSMRAPTYNVLIFVQQSFLHELAVASGRDHLEVLLETLNRSDAAPAPEDPPRPGSPPPVIYSAKRASDVVKLVADKSGYGSSRPKGRGLGIAFSFGLGGHVATAVDASVDEKKHITVHKITVALDVGPIVNLSGAENQAQGALLTDFKPRWVGRLILRTAECNSQTSTPIRLCVHEARRQSRLFLSNPTICCRAWRTGVSRARTGAGQRNLQRHRRTSTPNAVQQSGLHNIGQYFEEQPAGKVF